MTTYLFWDPVEDNIIQERDDTGALTAEYTTEPGHFGNVISQNQSGEASQFHYDAQGSTLGVTDDNQQITDTRAYTAFGETSESTGNTVFPFLYVGQAGYYFDEERGSHYIRRRDYDSNNGRWLSIDPVHNVVHWLGAYIYSLNRPLILTDPSGLICRLPGFQCCCCADAISIPKATIVNIDKILVPSRTDPNPPLRAVWGKQFEVVVETSWDIHDVIETKNMDCGLEWWERIRTQPPDRTFKRWINKVRTDPESPTFDGWNHRSKACPGSETSRIIDQPSIGLGQGNVTHEIYIAIRIKSNPECDCKRPSVVAFAYASLRTIGGIGDVRNVEPLDELPRGAGKPPGF